MHFRYGKSVKAVGAGCLLALSGCSPHAAKGSPPADTSGPARTYNLTIYGYNYSNTGISSFEVNGQGGGNLTVSTPTSSGGASVCCISISSPLLTPQPVTIKWSRDTKTWCKQTVTLSPPLPAKPEYFQVHFYPDGHIEVAVAAEITEPRLLMNRDSRGARYGDPAKNVVNDAEHSVCKHGY